jgi:hypothetical protein
MEVESVTWSESYILACLQSFLVNWDAMTISETIASLKTFLRDCLRRAVIDAAIHHISAPEQLKYAIVRTLRNVLGRLPKSEWPNATNSNCNDASDGVSATSKNATNSNNSNSNTTNSNTNNSASTFSAKSPTFVSIDDSSNSNNNSKPTKFFNAGTATVFSLATEFVLTRIARSSRIQYDKLHVCACHDVVLSPDGRYLTTATPWVLDVDPNGALMIWELETGRAVRAFQKDLGGVGFGNDNSYCTTLWNPKTHHIALTHNTNAISIFAPFAVPEQHSDDPVSYVNYFAWQGWSRPPKFVWTEGTDDDVNMRVDRFIFIFFETFLYFFFSFHFNIFEFIRLQHDCCANE